jgi:transcriptional regulator with XRE-family HTH domain
VVGNIENRNKGVANIVNKIGLMIAKERIKKNMSRPRLAELAGCSTRAIEYWENGKRKITLDFANKIFNALGLTIKIGIDSEI